MPPATPSLPPSEVDTTHPTVTSTPPACEPCERGIMHRHDGIGPEMNPHTFGASKGVEMTRKEVE